MNILEKGIEFIAIFLVIYLLYYFATIKKCRKNNEYIPSEVSIITIKYKIDVQKINLYQMIKVTSLVTSLVLAFSIVVVHAIVQKLVLTLFMALLLALILLLIIYPFIGSYYKKQELKR